MKFLLIFFIIGYISVNLYSQPKLAPDYFRSPLDIPLRLSGSFGELRTDHFHAGIDFKTDGVEGKNIYSIADGYVSRIKITLKGYGKSLYITHPNGLVSVYAHLKSYNKEIDDFLKRAQYDTRTYEIDIFPSKDVLKVSKGDIIALSGNTGGSAGPHLHFEIRDEFTEHAYNPLMFNFNIVDNTRPKIFELYCYPIENNSNINGKNAKTSFQLHSSNGIYSILNNEILNLGGKIGFALETNDYFDYSNNKCGVFSIEQFINDSLIYSFELNEISFLETRYINSHMDYYLNEVKRKKIHKSFLEPNNKLNIYNNVVERGIVDFKKDSFYNVKFVIKDFNKNQSVLNFKVKGIDFVSSSISKKNYQIVLPYNQENFYETDDIKLNFPLNSLYDTLLLKYSVVKGSTNMYSDIHIIHDKYTPIHYYFSISLKAKNIPEKYYDKAVITTFNDNGTRKALGGYYLNGYVTAESRDFGKFCIMLDTISPTIKPVNIISNMKNNKYIDLKINDDFSGVYFYNGYIDENWVLFEYDYKQNLIRYYFDEYIEKNQNHKLKVIVSDLMENQAIYETEFYY